ncbi:MAG: hypothetical protein FJ298_12400 [Planctomycetes bacterium]|nr:hypothetical protein [Planctomycetota bacterium]
MSQRQLLALAAAFALAVSGVAAWYVAGELEAEQERLQLRLRRAPAPTTMTLPLTRIERA